MKGVGALESTEVNGRIPIESIEVSGGFLWIRLKYLQTTLIQCQI